MQKLFLLVLAFLAGTACFSQTYNADSALTALRKQKDSTLNALKHERDSVYRSSMHADSEKVNKEFEEKEKWEKVKGIAVYPVFKGYENAGVVPVKDPTEIPDPKMEYKLLFEVTRLNPDSIAKDPNFSLVEIARVINLHVASGVPLKNIKPVIVVHAAALRAITNNESYKTKYKIDNPNVKLVKELEDMGAKFIACGQAMTFFEIKKEELLPSVKISLTAQTVISSYQLKGYALFWP